MTDRVPDSKLAVEARRILASLGVDAARLHGGGLVVNSPVDDLGLRLIRHRRRDQFERMLQVILMLGKIDRQEIEQVGIPRLCLHRVDRMHDSVAHQAVPQAIDDRPRETPILGVSH